MDGYGWARVLLYGTAVVALVLGGGMALNLFQLNADALIPVTVVVLVGAFGGMHFSRRANQASRARERQDKTGQRVR